MPGRQAIVTVWKLKLRAGRTKQRKIVRGEGTGVHLENFRDVPIAEIRSIGDG